MELSKIEAWIEAYFEGTATEAQEEALRSYFLQEEVPEHLQIYKQMFVYFAEAKSETSSQQPVFKSTRKPVHTYWYAVAASLVLALGLGYFYNQNRMSVSEQEEALQAYWQTKDALQFLSSNLNKSNGHLSHISHFSENAEKVFKTE